MLELATLKQFARVSSDADDDALGIIISRVEGKLEELTGLQLTETRDDEMILMGGSCYLWPVRGPVTYVSSIVRVGLDSGAAVSSSWYEVIDERKILWTAQTQWPKVRYRLTCDTGYESTSDIPDELVGIGYDVAKRLYMSGGGIETESAAEHRINWRHWLETDEKSDLDRLSMGSPF